MQNNYGEVDKPQLLCYDIAESIFSISSVWKEERKIALDNFNPNPQQTVAQQQYTCIAPAVNDSWYKRLKPVGLTLCIIGTMIGLFLTYYVVTGLISLTKPWNPNAMLSELSGVGGGLAIIAAIFAIPLLSICVPPLIFRTRKTAPNRRVYKWVRILTPIVLIAVFLICLVITSDIHESYREDTDKGAVFTCFTNDQGSLDSVPFD